MEMFEKSLNKTGEEGSQKSTNEPEVQKAKRNVVDLKDEEETLRNQLEELKKNNFSLLASISAWQVTLNRKKEELVEAELKLNKIRNEIWNERENFCSKPENEHGILSEWWQTHMNEVSELEKFGAKRDENRREQIEKLRKDIEDLKEEAARIEEESEEGIRHESENLHPEKMKKKVRFTETENCPKEFNYLFSIVDLENVRRVNRKKYRQNHVKK